MEDTLVNGRRVVTVNEACALADVTRNAIYNWMRAGKIEFVCTAGGQRRIFADTLFRGTSTRREPVRAAEDTPMNAEPQLEQLNALVRPFARPNETVVETVQRLVETERPMMPSDERVQALIAALRYWQTKKLAVDAVRPEFTRDQMRELNAAESRLLAFDPDELEASLRESTPPAIPDGRLFDLLDEAATLIDDGAVAPSETMKCVYREAIREALLRLRVGASTPTPPQTEDVVCQHGAAMDVHCCHCHSGFIFDRDHECPPTMEDAAEMLWVVLANVSGGDWTKQTPEWQDAAARWRDNYFAALGKPVGGALPAPSPEGKP